jgi:GMP synthase-like glutamine amidotransferase
MSSEPLPTQPLPTEPGAQRPLVLAIENESVDPPLWVGEWIQECGIEVRILRGWDGDDIPDQVPDGVSGLLPLGGAMGANDDHLASWLIAERSLLADAVRREVPVLGLCLGAQLLAVANGGRVELGSIAEVGLTHVRRTADGASDAVIGQVDAPSDRIPAAQWHQDHITELPDGAILLLTNDACRVQAYRVGPSAYGLQMHPEVDPDTFASWAGVADEALERSGRDAAEASDQVRAACEDLIRAWRPATRAWCDQVWAYASTQEAGTAVRDRASDQPSA